MIVRKISSASAYLNERLNVDLTEARIAESPRAVKRIRPVARTDAGKNNKRRITRVTLA